MSESLLSGGEESLQTPMRKPLEIPQELQEKGKKETEEWIENIKEGYRRMATDPEYRKLRSEKLF
jgi:hypothetical protein